LDVLLSFNSSIAIGRDRIEVPTIKVSAIEQSVTLDSAVLWPRSRRHFVKRPGADLSMVH
jgi:hypothetical protein